MEINIERALSRLHGIKDYCEKSSRSLRAASKVELENIIKGVHFMASDAINSIVGQQREVEDGT